MTKLVCILNKENIYDINEDIKKVVVESITDWREVSDSGYNALHFYCAHCDLLLLERLDSTKFLFDDFLKAAIEFENKEKLQAEKRRVAAEKRRLSLHKNKEIREKKRLEELKNKYD